MEQAAASKRQIFSNAEGFKMLCNELLSIIKREDPTLFADSVGDDVHQWDVWMSNFDPASPLAKVRACARPRKAKVDRSPSDAAAAASRITCFAGLHPLPGHG